MIFLVFYFSIIIFIHFAYSTDASPNGDHTPESQKSGDRLKSFLGNIQTYRLVIVPSFFIFLYFIFYLYNNNT